MLTGYVLDVRDAPLFLYGSYEGNPAPGYPIRVSCYSYDANIRHRRVVLDWKGAIVVRKGCSLIYLFNESWVHTIERLPNLTPAMITKVLYDAVSDLVPNVGCREARSVL